MKRDIDNLCTIVRNCEIVEFDIACFGDEWYQGSTSQMH